MSLIGTAKIKMLLANARAQQRYRQRRVVEAGGDGRTVLINQRRYVNFSANDYLGLSQHPKLKAAWQEGVTRFGIGSTGSGHIAGYHHALYDFENALADWLGFERAIVFPSGYSANQAVIKILLTEQDRVIIDRLSHASIVEAARLSPALLKRFQHNDVEDLCQKLIPHSAGTLVITEGVFSMEGDEAPLNTIMQQTHKMARTWLMVDDAHGIGLNGYEGRGSCDKYGIVPDILVVTFGKAFGMSGAAILCQETVAEFFIQQAKPLIYSTAIPPAHAYTLSAALTLIKTGDDLRAKLYTNIQLFKGLLKSMGIDTFAEGAIQPVILGGDAKALKVADHMAAKGLLTVAIRPPTVPPNSARLRVTLSASHLATDIQQLCEALDECIR